METDTVDLLCNPYNRERLMLVKEEPPKGKPLEFLVGEQTGERFPIQHGIPMLYDVSRLEGYNLTYQDFYRKAARFYDSTLKTLAFFVGGNEARFRRQYLQHLEVHETDRVLEVSVGTGANLRLLPFCKRVYGLDLSEPMLRQCQNNLERWSLQAELIFGNAEALPFKDEVFDVVFHVGGINAFSDRTKAICEMIRVAKPGTRLVIVDETALLMKALRWMPSVKRMINEWGDRFHAPIEYVPPDMREIQVREIVGGYFYMLSFRKPY